MNKKGFTLVEVLAVIIILSILLIITVPKILNSVSESKKGALKASSKALIKEAFKEYINNMDTISNTGKTYTITNKAFVGNSFTVSGQLPDNGSIYINRDGQVAASLFKDNYCVYKDFFDKEVSVSDVFSTCALNVPGIVLESCYTTTPNATGVTITDYNNTCSKNVMIPNTIGGLSVTIIGANAFNANLLTSASIPSTVTSLGSYAFAGNRLTSILIPNSVTSMDTYAFNGNLLKDLKLSDNLSTISGYAFKDNDLVNISVPSNVKTIQVEAFNLNNIKSISLKEGFTSIGVNSFANNILTTVNMSSNVTIDTTSISPTFYTTYVTNNSRSAGIYTSPSQTGTWTKQ